MLAAARARVDFVHGDRDVRRPRMVLDQHRLRRWALEVFVLGAWRVDDPALMAVLDEQDQLVVVAPLDLAHFAEVRGERVVHRHGVRKSKL